MSPKAPNEIAVDKSEIRRHLQHITSIEPPRNCLHASSLDTVAHYLERHFASTCDTVEEQTYAVGKDRYKNILCRFNGQAPEKIVIGAHYDVAGDQPGADENASAVAGVL